MGVNTLNGYFYKPALGAKGTVEMELFHTKLDIADAEIKLNKDTVALKANLDSPTFITQITVPTIYIDVIASPIANSIEVKPNADTDDFFTFKTISDRPTIKREGGKFIYFESTNVYDVGISFRADDTYSGTLNYEKDNHMMTVVGKNSPFGFKANSDYVNYIKLQTVGSIPEMTVVASNALKINAGGTNSLLLNHSGGSVGIGTSSPSGLLDLNVATDADAHFLLSENDVTKWDIYNDHADDALQIKAGTTLVIELDTSGNLNIKAGASFKIGGTALAYTDITGALGNVLEDTTPELGGEMDCGAHSVGFTLQTATGDGTTTIDWKLGLKFRFTFGAQADTLTFTAPSNPCNLMLMVKQDGTGSRDLTFPGTVIWLGDEPTWTDGGANKSLAVAIFYDGTNYWCTGSAWQV